MCGKEGGIRDAKKEDYENAIKNYQDAIEIFKEIKWENYIEPIFETIKHIKEKQKQKQEMDQKQIQREKNLSEIKESIKEKGEIEESSLKAKAEAIISETELQKIKIMEEKKEKEELLYSLLEKANTLYEKNSFDESINLYKEVKKVIKNLGKDWERYIPKIETSISDIERKKQRVQYEEREKQRRKQKAVEEEKRIIEQISDYVKKEKERAKHQELEKLRKQKDIQYREQQKEKAFKFLDSAQEYINEEDFDKAINAYQEAGNIFAEIQWIDELPLIQDSIQELEKKRKEHDELRRARIQREIEIRKKDLEFNKKVLDQIDKEHEKLKIQELEQGFVESQLKTEHVKLPPGKTREIQREELRKYFEMQREDSFKLLEQAEDFMKQKDYDSAIDYYKRAESKLKEIKFPTNAIRDTIDLIKIKREEDQLLEQHKVDVKSQKLEKQREFQEMIASSLEKERKRLQLKQLKVEEYERSRELIEQKQNKAFNMLDEAEKLVKNEKYEDAVERYREAQFLLNQIHYPTESIAEVIGKTILLKNQKEKEAELKLKGELQKLEEERILKQLEERRKREERKQKLAQHYAAKERERLIQEQQNIREAAYSLLDKGSVYLKQTVPDYNQAISMYIQAKNLLQEKIGWAPEIRNLENLINSLRQEKLELLQRQKAILEQEKKREQEYSEFQTELKERRKKAIEEQKKKEQKLRELEKRKKEVIKRRDYALELITIGKNLSANQQFEEAYEKLNEAISVFKSIGWIEQIKYIQQEIKSIKELEAELKREALETQRYKEGAERRDAKVQQLQIKKEKELKKAVGEVDVLTDEVSEIIEMKKKEQMLTEQQREEQIKKEAKEFGKSMGEMIKIKEELLAQIRQAEKEEKLRQEEEERKKGRKEVDDIAKMLKEVAKRD
ncbi:MAG: hypothetical protein P8Y70_03515 [Candidatus Lokiarchaeota archaeon]